MKRRVSGLRGKCWYDQAIGFRFISPREVSEELETRGAIETRALSSSRIARTADVDYMKAATPVSTLIPDPRCFLGTAATAHAPPRRPSSD
jgi:hypothetical protein